MDAATNINDYCLLWLLSRIRCYNRPPPRRIRKIPQDMELTSQWTGNSICGIRKHGCKVCDRDFKCTSCAITPTSLMGRWLPSPPNNNNELRGTGRANVMHIVFVFLAERFCCFRRPRLLAHYHTAGVACLHTLTGEVVMCFSLTAHQGTLIRPSLRTLYVIVRG